MEHDRVLVTGGLGFIGHEVVRHLQTRAPETEIVVYDNRRSYAEHVGKWDVAMRAARHERTVEMVTWIDKDILDGDALAAAVGRVRPQRVLHLAGVPLASVGRAAPREPIEANVTGTMNLMFALEPLADVVERVVYVSSSFVYGHFMSDVVTETEPLAPIDLYGMTKWAAERLTRAYCAQLGIEHVVVRPSAVYGPRDTNHRVVQTLIEAALDGKPLRLHAGSSPLDFTFVEDLAQGLVGALYEPPAAGQTFNVTSGRARTLEEVVAAIESLIPEIDVEYIEPPFERPRRGTLDISRARELLRYQPRHQLEDGVAAYLEDYRRLAARVGITCLQCER